MNKNKLDALITPDWRASLADGSDHWRSLRRRLLDCSASRLPHITVPAGSSHKLPVVFRFSGVRTASRP